MGVLLTSPHYFVVALVQIQNSEVIQHYGSIRKAPQTELTVGQRIEVFS